MSEQELLRRIAELSAAINRADNRSKQQQQQQQQQQKRKTKNKVYVRPPSDVVSTANTAAAVTAVSAVTPRDSLLDSNGAAAAQPKIGALKTTELVSVPSFNRVLARRAAGDMMRVPSHNRVLVRSDNNRSRVLLDRKRRRQPNLVYVRPESDDKQQQQRQTEQKVAPSVADRVRPPPFVGKRSVQQNRQRALARFRMQQKQRAALARPIQKAKKKKDAPAGNRVTVFDKETNVGYRKMRSNVLVRSEMIQNLTLKVPKPPRQKPVCLFFLRGKCNKDDCPYSHVKVSRDAELCEDFQRDGRCPLGDACEKLHTVHCLEFVETGKCSKEGCKLVHKEKKNKQNKKQRIHEKSEGEQQQQQQLQQRQQPVEPRNETARNEEQKEEEEEDYLPL